MVVYSSVPRYHMVDIRLRSLRIARFASEEINHIYWRDVVESDVVLHLISSNICNSHADISKLANLPDIIRISTRRMS
jgi:hypothetical protein